MVEARDTLSILVLTQYGVLGALLVAATLLAARRGRPHYALVVFALNLTTIGAAAIAFPIYATYYPSVPSAALFVAAAVVLVSVMDGTALLLPLPSIDRLLRALDDSARLQNYGLLVLSMVICLGGPEAVAQVGTRLGLIAYYVPLETRRASLTGDWRLAHIKNDDLREPDPVLLWRPIPRYPYSSQGFKGPLIEVPKPRTVFRIMCYGDSNTDGLSIGRAWPARLQVALERLQALQVSRTYEVVNAGVVGYSSYQGLMRLREEVDRYAPDMVLVSFGWNDAAQAIGPPDEKFASSALPPELGPWLAFLRRVLLRYRLDLVVLHHLHPVAPAPLASTGYVPRVSLADFAGNLRALVDTASRHGAVPVLLTRPHRAAPDVLRNDQGWRRHVPSYNAEVLRVAAELRVPVVDVERFFEGKAGLFSDEAHLTARGHDEMATLLAEELRVQTHLQ